MAAVFRREVRLLMAKYRKTPVVVEAVQWNGDFTQELSDFLPARCTVCGLEIFIPTLEGVMKASAGDWIIEGVRGEFYPCKPDIFEATYEKA